MSNSSEKIFPKFLIADNSNYPNNIYVVHTEYPRFILNISNDDILWLEEFNKEDESEIIENSESWIKSALKFYDFEIKNAL